MSARLRRVHGLLARYRVDRRLPPSVTRLLRDRWSYRRRELANRAAARMKPTLLPGGDVAGPIARLGRHRVATAGALDVSLADLAHDHAQAVVARLREAGVDVFVIGRSGESIVMGIDHSDRDRACTALIRLPGTAWYLDYHDGSRRGLLSLADAGTSRPARRARSWRLFRAFAWGDRAVGRDQAAELTFWQPGSSGLVERIGTRGQDRFDPRCPATTELLDGRRYPGRTAFPVGRELERFTGPVDVVYTWVDGQDPEWQAALRAVLEDHDGPAADQAVDPARYRSRDELLYSMRSVWALCGWARTIFVVTAGQVPDWLVGHDRVRVVDHSEILPASALPTFNSHAIESSLHRIDELAEHFIYFNDDMFVGRPLRPEIFFTPNGLPRVFSSDARVPGVEDEHTLAVDTAARRGRELLAEHFGRVATFKPHHSPYPLRRSTLEEIDREFADVVKTTSHSRFRDPADLSIAASFALHYGLATGRAVPGEIHTDYVHVESTRLSWHLDRIGSGRDLDTFCLNETETVPGEHHDREVAISRFLEGYFPVPAPWERPLGTET